MSAIETVKLYLEKQISSDVCRVWLEDNLNPLDMSFYLTILDELVEQQTHSSTAVSAEELKLKAFSLLVSCMHESVLQTLGFRDRQIKELEESLKRLKSELSYCQNEGLNLLNQIEMCGKKIRERAKLCQGGNATFEANS